MVVVIRSQGGKRSVTLKTSKDIEEEKSEELKMEILNILKSLKFSLNLQLVDEGTIKCSLNVVDPQEEPNLEEQVNHDDSDESDPLVGFNIAGLRFD